jgi:hypothetical protein
MLFLVKKEVGFFETSVHTYQTAVHTYQTTWRRISKDSILHKKCGLIGTEIIQRVPAVTIESTAVQ